MMNNFIELFEREARSTIEALVGVLPRIEKNPVHNYIPTKSITCFITVTDDKTERTSSIALMMPTQLVIKLSDLMMGEVENTHSEINEDDIDAFKEVVSTIFGTIGNVLSAQKELPQLRFETVYDEQIHTKKMDYVSFDCHLNGVAGIFTLNTDDNLQKMLHHHSVLDEETPTEKYNILDDVVVPVRVRLGQKTMTVREIEEIGINSIVELEQRANDPLDIVVDGVIIGRGEVVIVDGNFGIQITDIFDGTE